VRALPIEEANEEWAGVDAIFNEIIEEELMDAVRVRTLREYGHILSTRRPHPNSAIAPTLLMPGSYSRFRSLLGI
jgi:hypothetical protein